MKYLQNRQGQRFEFKGTQKLKRQYEKENQKEILKALFKVMSDEDFKAFNNADDDLREKLSRKYLPEIDVTELQEQINKKYIRTLICYSNNVTDEVVKELFAELYEDYGDEQVNNRFAEILNEVFTQVGKVDYMEMPTWE